MSILIAEGSGFCLGVRYAVEKARETSERKDKKIYCLGDIIHNNDVIKDLKKSGIVTVEDISLIEDNSIVIIRAHGIGSEVYEKLRQKDIEIIDATCVYVKKIHKLAQEKHAMNKKIVIIGDSAHPEIIGINGWCDNSAYVVMNEEEAKRIPFDPSDELVIFCQTTFEKNKYRKIVDKIKITFKNIEEFDTICKSTIKRQQKAEELSKNCDIVIVLGGERSSNTKKIFDICSSNCNETYFVENLAQLPKDIKLKNRKIGITAGASTPANVIEEVYNFMNESLSKEKDLNFEDAINQASLKLSSGTIVKGRVLGKSDSELYVDVSYKSDGILKIEELSEDDEFENIKQGDEIEVYVTRVNDNEGYVLLSKKRVDSIRSADTVRTAFESKTPLRVKVRNAVKGGVIAQYKGFEIFIPASQITDGYIRDLSSVIGTSPDIIVTEFDLRKKRIIGSARILIERDKEENLNKLWDDIEIGKEYEGIIKSFVDFGAFVNIGPIDGLLHISEMTWGQLKHPSEMFQIGQELTVTILSFDKVKKKVSLGFKKQEDDPWYDIVSFVKADDEIEVKIVRIVPFGAFAEVKPGVEGLIHISNISHKRIGHPAENLRIDDIIKVKVLEVDKDAKRIALSIKELLPLESEPESVKTPDAEIDKSEHSEDMKVSLGDVIDFNIKE